MDVLSSGQEAYWQDQATLLGNQRNDNYASRVTQTNYLNDAASARAAAENVMANAKRQKFGTILGTAASIAGAFGGGSGGGTPTGSNTSFGTLSANAGHRYTWNFNTATGRSGITGGWKLGQSNYKNGFSLGGW